MSDKSDGITFWRENFEVGKHLTHFVHLSQELLHFKFFSNFLFLSETIDPFLIFGSTFSLSQFFSII